MVQSTGARDTIEMFSVHMNRACVPVFRAMPRTRSAFLLHNSLVTTIKSRAGWRVEKDFPEMQNHDLTQHDLWTLTLIYKLWTLIRKFDLCKVCFAVAFQMEAKIVEKCRKSKDTEESWVSTCFY